MNKYTGKVVYQNQASERNSDAAWHKVMVFYFFIFLKTLFWVLTINEKKKSFSLFSERGPKVGSEITELYECYRQKQ